MRDYNYLSSELCKLGISKKEADVYLVLLELGYCSVQKIAKKIESSRPTVYRILKNLKKKNLINTVQKGKRNYFIAGSPDALLNMLQIEKRRAEEQEREFLRIINILQDQYSFSSDENTIKTFADKEKRLALEKLANTQSTEIQVFSTYLDKNIEKAFSSIQKRLGSSLQIKRLHFFETKNKPEKHIENKLFKGNSTISNKNVVITDKVFLFEKNAIHIIKQKNTVKFFELMFDSFWKNL